MAEYSKLETEYLLHLVICTLHNQEPEKKEGVDFCALLELAKEQEIFNLINDKIQQLSFVSDDIKAKFRNYNLSELNRMIAISSQRSIIFSMLNESRIKYMPLKGLIFKDYYPKESMRQMSDNDILIDETKRSEAADIMQQLGYKAFDTTQNSDDFFKEPYYTFELHRSLFDEESRFSPRFDSVWENANQDDNNEFLFHMAKEDVYVYSICHMYKHYIKACCGLRFLVDNYLFLKKEENALNWQYINSELSKHGLLEYERQTSNLAKKLFDGEALSEEEQKLIKSYTDFGLFGDKKGKILQQYSGSKVRYILRRLFPPRDEILYNYPIYEKAPYLLPILMIHRFFKGIFNFSKRNAEFKTVKEIQKENRG